MGLFSRKNQTEQSKGFNAYSLITSLAIVVLFVAIGLVVLGFRGVFSFNRGFLLVLLTLFIVSGAAWVYDWKKYLICGGGAGAFPEKYQCGACPCRTGKAYHKPASGAFADGVWTWNHKGNPSGIWPYDGNGAE